jgi:MFS family permease
LDRKQLNIYLFYAIALLQGMVFYGPIATLYRQARGLNVFDITLIESICLVLTILLEVPWGVVADRIGYKKTMVICNVLYLVSKLVFWKADGFGLFLAERLILAVVCAGLSGCDIAFLFLSAGSERSQKVFSIFDAMGTAGLIVAAAIYSTVIQNNYSLTAFLTVISYGLAMLLTFFLQDVQPVIKSRLPLKEQARLVVKAIGQEKSFIFFLIAAALLAESNQTITVFLNQLQYLRSGITPGQMGFIYILVTVSGLFSASAYRLIQRAGEARLSRVLFLTAGAACLAMALWASPWVSILGIILLRVSASVFNPIRMAVQNRQVSIADRATVLSVYSICMNMLGVGTNLVFGKIADIDVSYAMLAGAGFCFLGFVSYCVWNVISRRTPG